MSSEYSCWKARVEVQIRFHTVERTRGLCGSPRGFGSVLWGPVPLELDVFSRREHEMATMFKNVTYLLHCVSNAYTNILTTAIDAEIACPHETSELANTSSLRSKFHFTDSLDTDRLTAPPPPSSPPAQPAMPPSCQSLAFLRHS